MSKPADFVPDTPDDPDYYKFVRYEQMLADGIVHSRPHMSRLQREAGFPLPVSTVDAQGAAASFRLSSVKKFIREGMKEKQNVQPPPVRPGGRPRGRPRKARPDPDHPGGGP